MLLSPEYGGESPASSLLQNSYKKPNSYKDHMSLQHNSQNKMMISERTKSYRSI